MNNKPTPEEVAAKENINYRRPENTPKTDSGDGRIKNKHITKPKVPTITEIDPNWEIDIFTLREKPMPIATVEALAARLVRWVLENKEDKIVIGEWLRETGYNFNAMRRFRDRSPKFDAAYKFALMCIGVTREKGMLLNKLNASGVIASMSAYSEQWKEIAERKAALQQKDASSANVQFIVLPKVPESSVVPELPDKPIKKDEDE